MNELLSKETMSSLQIAEITGKRHDAILRDIKNLLKQDVDAHNFVGVEYTDKKGEKRPCYELTKKGCLILASGYNARLRERIIDRWEELETEKQQGGFAIPQSFSEALQLAADQARQIEEQQKAIEQKDARISKLQPKADFADAAFQAEGKVDIGQAAKILKLPFGRNTLFKKLKEKGILFGRNEPKQKYVDAGYFELTQLPPIHRSNHPDLIVMKVICTQKGLALINKLFGGTIESPKLSPIK